MPLIDTNHHKFPRHAYNTPLKIKKQALFSKILNFFEKKDLPIEKTRKEGP
jgi:hypothetical protein